MNIEGVRDEEEGCHGSEVGSDRWVANEGVAGEKADS